ncbi:MAG: alpha/beta fold hydrolase [Candidatus Eiseniibacteriota bacterium]
MSNRTADGYREGVISAQDGIALYYRDYGDPLAPRPPVLCLTGLSRNSKDYHEVALRLSHQRRVLCPDYRGRGRSGYDPDWRNYTPTTYINDMRHLLAALNVYHVVVMGTSLGAFLAMGLAVLAPSVVAGAVLNDAGPAVNAGGLDRIMAYVSDDRPLDGWDAAIARMREIFPQLHFDDPSAWRIAADKMFKEGADGKLHYDWDIKLAEPLRRSKSALPPLWPLFMALGARPVLALRGALSDILLPDTLEAMKTALPDITCVTVPGVGHTPTLLEPVSVEALDAYFARV